MRSLWLLVSALWIAGVLYGAALDARSLQELSTMIPIALVPPSLPPLMLAVLVRFMAGFCRP
jgi:hypothetical protein